ncbi:FMN reductase [Jatrophihabitans endophyticus]|uniref:FMN reductase n=1 Tax=Jatrophihabitans endophyticus TaxID=1206085 RepID=A0A1M5K6V2_9ACTN|nr:NAD(P)H-dependent oxidoreductase [Jatrophihabitans endophyticus]SHG48547.1 FMN reductase [Jatrophihabitans endophyticus]
MGVTVLVGNPKPHSRTWQAAHLVARELTGRPADVDLDLASFGPALLDWGSEAVADAVARVQDSSLLVVASPTYKATYTGLLKLFCDRIGGGALGGLPAVPLMLGGHWKHALAAEVHLKPLLAELGAATPTAALYLLDSEWDSGDTLAAWLPTARRALGLAGPAQDAS